VGGSLHGGGSVALTESGLSEEDLELAVALLLLLRALRDRPGYGSGWAMRFLRMAKDFSVGEGHFAEAKGGE